MIRKLDRRGKVRCECTVEEAGIRYNGTLYRSLSAAATAAAKDLGLRGGTQNGFTFFGLSKPPRKDVNPLVSLHKAWQRYRDRLHATLETSLDDNKRERMRALVEEHRTALAKLCKDAAQ